MVEISCGKETTACVTEDNEVYIWGRSLIEEEVYDEPTLVVSLDARMFDNDEESSITTIERIFPLEDYGLLAFTN